MTARCLFLGRHLRIPSVHSFEWGRIPEDLAVLDYDIIVLDFTATELQEPKKDAPWGPHEAFRVVRAPNFPSIEQWASPLLRGQLKLVCVGHPSTPFIYPTPELLTGVVDGQPAPRAAGSWLPRFPITYNRVGKRISLDRSMRGSRFLEGLSRFEWAVKPGWEESTVEHAYLKALADDNDWRLEPRYESLARTQGTGEPLAIRLRYLVRTPSKRLVFTNQSEVVWFPAPAKPDNPETWTQLLNDVGLSLSTPPPEWADAFLTPRELKSTAHLEEASAALVEARKAVEDAKAELENEQRFKPLLFAYDTQLEETVRESLLALGVEVDPPSDGRHQDLFVTFPDGTRGALEVKGLEGFVKKSGLRQVQEWRSKGIAEETGRAWKAVMVVNTHRKLPPAKRPPPYDKAEPEEYAQAERICVLPTLLLFEAIVRHQNGEFDAVDFWSRVVGTSGIFDHSFSPST